MKGQCQMQDHRHHNTDMPVVVKGLLLILALLLGSIGVIGLLLPIIPGIVFLALAAWVMSHVSAEFAGQLHSHVLWQKTRRRWGYVGELSAIQCLKLSLLLASRSLLNTLGVILKQLRR